MMLSPATIMPRWMHQPNPVDMRPQRACPTRRGLLTKDGIIHQARSGCQWEALPREFGSKTSVHDTLQRWVKLGVFEKIMAVLI